MRNVKQFILIFTYILTIISVVIMILLSSCGDNVIRITTDDSEKVKRKIEKYLEGKDFIFLQNYYTSSQICRP